MADPRNTQRPRSAGSGPVTGDLGSRIARAQGERASTLAQSTAPGSRDHSGLGVGLRLGSEFIAAILVGAGLGYVLDLWLKTGPWIMLVMLLIGFAAGVLNVTRSASAMNKAAPPPPGSDLGAGDDDDDD